MLTLSNAEDLFLPRERLAAVFCHGGFLVFEVFCLCFLGVLRWVIDGCVLGLFLLEKVGFSLVGVLVSLGKAVLVVISRD